MFDWLGLKKIATDPNALTTRPHESDSYYRFKFRHETRSSIKAPARRDIPPRVDGLRKISHGFSINFIRALSAIAAFSGAPRSTRR